MRPRHKHLIHYNVCDFLSFAHEIKCFTDNCKAMVSNPVGISELLVLHFGKCPAYTLHELKLTLKLSVLLTQRFSTNSSGIKQEKLPQNAISKGISMKE